MLVIYGIVALWFLWNYQTEVYTCAPSGNRFLVSGLWVSALSFFCDSVSNFSIYFKFAFGNWDGVFYETLAEIEDGSEIVASFLFLIFFATTIVFIRTQTFVSSVADS